MPLLREMPGFEDWVELHQGEVSKEQAESMGEVVPWGVPGCEITRRATFDLCDHLMDLKRRAAEERRQLGSPLPTRRPTAQPPSKRRRSP